MKALCDAVSECSLLPRAIVLALLRDVFSHSYTSPSRTYSLFEDANVGCLVSVLMYLEDFIESSVGVGDIRVRSANVKISEP